MNGFIVVVLIATGFVMTYESQFICSAIYGCTALIWMKLSEIARKIK